MKGMNKAKSRLVFFIMIFTWMAGFGGCSLAVREEVPREDRLCGAYLLIDREENLRMASGGERTLKIESENTTENPLLSGSIVEGIYENHTVRFSGDKGYFVGFIPGEDNAIESDADTGFTDVKYNVNVTDNTEENAGEATFLVPADSVWSFRVYPVYRRSNGTFYALTDNASIMSCSGDTTDSAYSTHFENTVTEKVDGEVTKSVKVSLKLWIKFVDKAEKVLIKEMNQQDENIITTEVYNTGESTIKYKATPDASYVIVEELRHNNKKGDYIFRSIYSFGEDNTTFYHQSNFPKGDDSVGAAVIEITK